MSLMDMALNFSREISIWVKNGAPVVSEEEFTKRASICIGCEFYDEKAFGGKGKCLKCGCSTFKLFLSTSKCPIDKWSKTKS